MTVTAVVQGTTRTASATVTALPLDTTLAVSCTPATVVRGARVSCAARLNGAVPFTVTRRRAEEITKQPTFRIDENPDAAVSAGAPYLWEGVAVTSTNVRFEVTVGPKTLAGTASFTVSKRAWAAPKLDGALFVQHALDPDGRMTATASNSTLGGSRPKTPGDAFNAARVTRADAGPNQGLAFLSDPFKSGDWEAYIHPGLDPVPAGLSPGSPGYQPWHAFHDDQNGIGSGTCTQAVFAVLVPEVERHEGVTYSADSHRGVAERAYVELALADNLEKVYVRSADDMEVREAGFQAWSASHSAKKYRQRQDAYDRQDYPVVDRRIGCRMDYNLNDP